MKTNEQFWLDDPNILFQSKDLAIKIIPDKGMSLNEQLNASFRFSIYFSIIIFIIRHDVRVLFFAIFIALFTIILHKNAEKKYQDKQKIMEKMDIGKEKYKDNKFCKLPTKNNPFMNVGLVDYKKFPNRPPACNITKEPIKRMMEEKYNHGMFRDIDDIFGRNASSRQFYTMPATTIPNDQKKFAEMLYQINPPNVPTEKQKHNNYYK